MAGLIRWAVRRRVRADARRLVGLSWSLLGAFIGTAAVLGYTLFDLATYVGPGGFANVVILYIVMSPMTIPVTSGLGALGALCGFVLARVILFGLTRRLRAG